MGLPQEYWRQRTLFEIASAVGTSLALDESTKNRTFGHYARVLVDMDLSRHVFDEILVERDDFAFKLGIIYERLPEFCNHCITIGHNITTCKWLQEKLVADPKNKIVKEVVVSKPQYVAKISQQTLVLQPRRLRKSQQQDLDVAQQENHNGNIHDNAAAQDTSGLNKKDTFQYGS
ncbi:putative NBS resistance protein [Trifolium pratense]|uniref:Putative NBS resistance protein n=1 Tax=Trifolium pratense TaxID=57577 RepID=A0A2K3LZN1_TRIPR|nr:putative NBS resistance protein [Trifolium pratense]